jgi:hypothetical protein
MTLLWHEQLPARKTAYARCSCTAEKQFHAPTENIEFQVLTVALQSDDLGEVPDNCSPNTDRNIFLQFVSSFMQLLGGGEYA